MKKSDLKKFAAAVRRRKKALDNYRDLVRQADELRAKALKVRDRGQKAWQDTAFGKLGLKGISFDREGSVYTFEDGTILTEKEVLGSGETG